ncbi:MAG: HD-GYP domain-containing protein [Phycisphaerae bacterium]|nr:HD-GYP domain-containing protein [Phycisphaerae bacterium]
MNETSKQLIHNLLELWQESNCHTQQLPDSPTSPPAELVFSQLPQTATEKISAIIEQFEQIAADNEMLGKELLDYYEQINATFSTISKVACCKTITEAMTVLTNAISDIIDSSFTYYEGLITQHFSSAGNNRISDNVLFGLYKNENHIQAQNFFDEHQSDLLEMFSSGEHSQVDMIGYNGSYNHDHNGRGNVLAVALTANDPEIESLGTIIFARDNTKEPFTALEMNLAASLSDTGSAVLGNLLYAEKLQKSFIQNIISLVRAMEAKDSYTSGHSTRVADLACQLGRHIGLDEKQVEHLHWAGLLHDIGKIGISDKVLTKPGRLTDEEFEHIKTHPVKSFNVLEPITALDPILRTVKHHHEHYNGSGYPDGLSGDEIPFHARILQIADVWDALTSTRSYRKAMPTEKAIAIMRNETGITMDPDLTNSFTEMILQQQNQTPALTT